MTIAWIILVYGALVLAGGVMGYVKAHSTASLIAGVGCGLLLMCAAAGMMRGAYQVGWWLAFVVAALLLARFGYASLSNFKMMPGGLMIILSLIALLVLLFGGRGQASV
jgi:uncharacterized membrane protein (UPF0136 family)